MDSEYGFIGQIKHDEDGTMYLQAHAITNIAWNEATREFYRQNEETGLRFYNQETLFGHVMVHAEPVIANSPSSDPRAGGIPEGHPPLNHFLGIPFFEPGGKKMNGMVGIANKPGGYTQDHVKFLEPFTVTCSNLIQAYGAFEENVRLIDTLEEKVKERTSELEMANKRLENANRQMAEASAAQLKNFACMSHEIRTPLNCVVGLSSLLLDSDLTPQQSDSMRMIVSSGELLSAIVNDVLDYSKLISGNVDVDVQPTDLQRTIDPVVCSIDVKASELNSKLRTYYDPLVPTVVDTDGRRLQQILYNLLGNAIKFSKSNGIVEFSLKVVERIVEKNGGLIMTSTDYMPTNESPIQDDTLDQSETSTRCPFHKPKANRKETATRCPFHKPKANRKETATCNEGGVLQRDHENGKKAKFLRFTVKDYGKGIDSADFSKIFKPFMQASGETEKLYGGTGLGLAITSKLVEALGGTISLDSKLGEWSTFSVDIPLSRDRADINAMSDSMKDTRIMVVNRDKNLGLSPIVVETYRLNVTELNGCNELKILSEVKGGIDPNRNYLCLIHEELYDAKDLAVFATAAPGTTIFTFGPKYCVKDTLSRGHYRSLMHLLPASFISSVISQTSGKAVDQSTIVEALPQVEKCSQLKVLIAEDNTINQKVLKRLLNRAGINNVDIVENGQEAVDATAQGDYDLVLMDMQMPVMDGIEATQLILQQNDGASPRPKIVFVTANAMGSFEQQVKDIGASGFIAKPFSLEKMQKFLASFLEGLDHFFTT